MSKTDFTKEIASVVRDAVKAHMLDASFLTELGERIRRDLAALATFAGPEGPETDTDVKRQKIYDTAVHTAQSLSDDLARAVAKIAMSVAAEDDKP